MERQSAEDWPGHLLPERSLNACDAACGLGDVQFSGNGESVRIFLSIRLSITQSEVLELENVCYKNRKSAFLYHA